MIDINKITGKNAYEYLKNYSGSNPYIKNLQRQYLKTNKQFLNMSQINYVLDFHDKEPVNVNKVVQISQLLGEELQKTNNLTFTPNKILIQYILGDSEKAFHVIGKLTTKQDSKIYWLPKSLVLDDPYFKVLDVPEINFTKYNEKLYNERGYKLLPHQEIGVKFLLERNGAILADEMGVAKTIQAVVAALESGAEKILIVCPASVKINWEREINTFCDDTCIIDSRRWNSAKFTIINYDLLKNFHTIGDGKSEPGEPIIQLSRELVYSKFDLVIIDEAHNLRNKNSIRGEIMNELCVKYKIPKVWLLTGTPVANKPKDFFNLLRLIKSPLVENWMHYTKRYCEGKQITKTLKNGRKKKIWLTDGASNLDELHQKTKHLLIRRLKTEVVDMPEKLITNVYHKLSDKALKEYENLWDDYLEERAKAKKKGNIDRDLVELGLLKKFIAMEAIPQTYEMAMEAIEQGEKVVIFTTFNDEQRELADLFGDMCVVHNGSMSIQDKQFSVDSFQNNPNTKIFIGNIISAGVGITLTSGNITIFNSYSWVPGDNAQAEDRTWRLGQKNTCKVYYQVFIDTVSERILETLKKKMESINKIIGETDERVVSEKIMDLVLEEIV